MSKELSPPMSTAIGDYTSQFGQDEFIDREVFERKPGGFFIDIGAHDGKTFSNTYFFEQARGWKGICIEPIPQRFADLRRCRSCICVQGCVSDKPGMQKFTVVEGADQLSRLGDAEAATGSGVGQPPGRIILVPCFDLNTLLAENRVSCIDYLSVDTEGKEYAILRSLDFERFRPACISVEHNRRLFSLWWLLRRHDYRLVAKLGADMVFVTDQRAVLMRRGPELVARLRLQIVLALLRRLRLRGAQ